MWDQEQLSTLLEKNQNYYDLPEKIEAYSQYCVEGITDQEEKVFNRFLKPPLSILVLGCGSGRETFYLAQKGYQVTGLDSSKKMLDEAQKHKKRLGLKVNFVEGNFIHLSPNLGQFDCVFFSENIYSLIPSQTLRLQTLKNAAKLLKQPNGFLLVYLKWWGQKKNPLYHNWLVSQLRSIKRRIFDYPLREAGDTFLQEKVGEAFIYFYYFQLAEEIHKEFKKAGFSVVDREGFGWKLKPRPSKTLFTSK